jgi:hypothetical protein
MGVNVATNRSAGVLDPAAMIITILSDDSRAHAYRTVQELLSTENQLPTWSSMQGIGFFDDQGYRLNPRFGPNWQLIGLLRVGEPDPDAVLGRLHIVLDRSVDRIRRYPESVEDWGVTCADAIDVVVALGRLRLEDLFDQESVLLDAPVEGSAPQGGLDGPVPHGSWLHRILYH